MQSPLVGTDWLAANLDQPKLRILDCSVVMRTSPDGSYTFVGGEEEWLRGHVPGSMFVDVLGKLSATDNPLPMMLPKAEDFAATMSGFGVGADTEVVLYDRSNHAWAARVWWMLRVYGFDAVKVVDGGWQKWSAEGRPASVTAQVYPRGDFQPNFRPALLATKQHVLESLQEPDVSIINSLSPEEHRGTAVTRFPRTGRIAGSCNVYCQSLIDPATHSYRPAPELRKIFEDAGALNRERTITYCGAGIAACSDALALAVLGLNDVAVYDGSLAEWTADPTVPMEADSSTS
jgi:thiosulfate/3-mercaptopyruvate sulfurtransferase